jgi:transcriptional regulator with XRE-family HTH domain
MNNKLNRQPVDPRFPVMSEGESVLKVIRDSLDCTQQEFAHRIGVAVVTISRWERGTAMASLTIPQIKALSLELRKIGMTVDNLPDTFGPIHAEHEEST